MTAATTATAGIAERYAAALFELADEARVTGPIAEELQGLQSMIDGSPDLSRMIRSPVIDHMDQQKVLDTILTKAEYSELCRHFVGTVSGNRRLFALSDMIRAYLDRIARQRGETSAEVVSAKELTKGQVTALAKALKQAVGSDVVLNQRVDPSILGGLVVQVGSKMIDSSLRTKLNRLSLAIKGIG